MVDLPATSNVSVAAPLMYQLLPQWTGATTTYTYTYTPINWTQATMTYAPASNTGGSVWMWDASVLGLSERRVQLVWDQTGPEQELTREEYEAAAAQMVAWQQAETERVARQQEQWRKQREKMAAAKERARVLLHSLLTPTQKRSLERHGHFYVTGNRGRRYCIRGQGQAGNVDWMEAPKKVGGSLCIHPTGVCDEDAWITQMLAIMHDEDHFLATANLTGGRWPPGTRPPAATVPPVNEVIAGGNGGGYIGNVGNIRV